MSKKYIKLHPVVNGELDTSTTIYPEVRAETINSENIESGKVLTADGQGGTT